MQAYGFAHKPSRRGDFMCKESSRDGLFVQTRPKVYPEEPAPSWGVWLGGCFHVTDKAVSDSLAATMHGKYSDGNEGKCRYCGFLSKHGTETAGFPSPRFYEVEHSERIAGAFFNHTAGYGLATKSEPMCFMEKINLMEIEQKQGREKLLEAVNADRKCDSWYPYMPGLSPIKHYEELQMQRLEQDRRALEVRLSDMALTAQRQGAEVAEKNAIISQKNVEIAEASKQLVGELRDIAVKSDRASRRITWLVVLLAIAQVIVGLIALFRESYTDQFLRRIFGH